MGSTPTTDRLHLAAGELSVELVPALGGCVAGFRHGALDLLRPLRAPAGASPHALYSGMFPMVPFANSIRDNRFGLDGQTYEVRPNMAGARLNYHGSGWQLPWAVSEHGGDFAELALDNASVDGVWRYGATQRFGLTGDALSVHTQVTNQGERAMPFSFGHHPWFPRHGQALVRFAASGIWLEDSDGHAEQLVPMPGDADYGRWREPPSHYVNTCYAGWDGHAEIMWPLLDMGLVLTGDGVFGHLMFHVPPDRPDIVCLEPQTNAPSALDGLEEGRIAPGVHILAPGESVGGNLRMTILTNTSAHS
jgi:aldose 1-epimerase